MMEPYRAAADVDVIPSYFPIPGYGILPVNAFLLKAAQPVLVDTGLMALSDVFMDTLSCLIDLGDLRWLWLTHADMDHIGSVLRILEMAPRLRVITTYIACGRMSLYQALPMDRVYLLNPGQSISVGDRTLTAAKPPSYDAAETTGFYDSKTSAFFCADCFGALMSEPLESAAEIGIEKLREGMVTWATVDAPWLHMVDRVLFAGNIGRVREMVPKYILSAHLPVACDMTDDLLDNLAAVPEAPPFIGPDQQAIEAMFKAVSIV